MNPEEQSLEDQLRELQPTVSPDLRAAVDERATEAIERKSAAAPPAPIALGLIPLAIAACLAAALIVLLVHSPPTAEVTSDTSPSSELRQPRFVTDDRGRLHQLVSARSQDGDQEPLLVQVHVF